MCTPFCCSTDTLDEDVNTVECPLMQKKPVLQLSGDLDFGGVGVGVRSNSRSITITNGGTADLRITSLDLDPPDSDFAAQYNLHDIAPGASDTITVELTPTTSGPHTLRVTLDSNDAVSGPLTVTLRGTGLAPKIEVAPELDFGEQVLGATPTMALSIKNIGDADLVLSTITFPGLFVADGTNAVVDGARLAPQATVDLQVQFTPDAVGAKAQDLTIASTDPSTPVATVRLKGEQVEPALEMFRGGSALTIVPFATTDNATALDSAFADNLQHGAASVRPGNLDADFKFPDKTDYATNAVADADPSIFRLRLKNLPVGFASQQVAAVLKVKTAAGVAIVGITGQTFLDNACHASGMTITLEKNGAVWESPYLRVATTVTDLSKDPNAAIVHSTAPKPAVMGTAAQVRIDHGLQFGRKLHVECTVQGQPVTADFVMGGRPFARVPVQFTWMGAAAPKAAQTRTAYAKLANLNQYWAGNGLEFVFKDPLVPIVTGTLPERRLLTIGDYTGAAVVAAHAFTVEVSVAITIAGVAHAIAITAAAVPQGSDPPAVGAAIKAAVAGWVSPGGPLAGVTLDAQVHDLVEPRVYLNFLGGLSATKQPQVLQTLGAHGPTDVTLEPTGGPVEKLEITGLVVRDDRTGLSDSTIDIFVPPVDRPFHDPIFHPPSAATRHWVRAFGPPQGDFISMVVESQDLNLRQNDDTRCEALCEDGFCALWNANAATMRARFAAPLDGIVPGSTSPFAVLNFGRWTEPCARFIVFMAEGSFNEAANDVQHESGHTLVDADHTIDDPAWFYKPELMHASGPSPQNAFQMTRHKIIVDTLEDQGGWKAIYKELPDGYGGAARARIADIAPAWLVNGLEAGQPAW